MLVIKAHRNLTAFDHAKFITRIISITKLLLALRFAVTALHQ